MYSPSLDLRNGEELEGVLGLKMFGQKLELKRCIHFFEKDRYLTARYQKDPPPYLFNILYF